MQNIGTQYSLNSLIKKYENIDKRHGGPFDRGSADSYYHRSCNPHFFVGDSYSSLRIEKEDMSEREVAEYEAGYEWNEEFGDKKNWG